jgi:hypothetical protein
VALRIYSSPELGDVCMEDVVRDHDLYVYTRTRNEDMAFERDSSMNDMIALSGSILLTIAALESRLTVNRKAIATTLYLPSLCVS